jgi:hypothetical protein
MSLSFRFREKLLGPWETARGFLVSELDYLFAGLIPLGPLIDSLQTQSFAQAGVYPPSTVMVSDVNGAPAFSPILPMALQFPSALTLSVLLPTGILANYNPAGFDAAAQVRLVGGAATQMTGMNASTALGGSYKLLVNVGATAITFLHRHSSSSAINQFICPGGPTYTLPTTTAFWVWYDPVAHAWQIIGK